MSHKSVTQGSSARIARASKRDRSAAHRTLRDRLLAGLATLCLVVSGVLAVSIPTATADSQPVNPETPATVTGDPLPTVQINGVAWSQVVVGNTVYVAGTSPTRAPLVRLPA